MATRVVMLLGAVVLLATLSLVGCGHYTCGATFGSSTCNASGNGISGGGSGNNSGGTPTAFIFSGLTSASGIASFTFSASGTDIFATPNVTAATAPSGGGGALIVVGGKYLYGTFYGTGLFSQVYGWTINTDGSLTAISGSPFTVNNWTGGILGRFATNPSGTLLFMTDPGAVQGTSTVHMFQVGTGGVLTEPNSPVLLPFSPGTMAMDGLGKYLYVLGILGTGAGTSIGAYSVGTNGALTAVAGSPFAFPMAQVAGDASGQYLIGTTGNNPTSDAHLYVFSISQSGTTAGALTQVTGSPFATLYSPLDIAVQPKGGELIYSFSQGQTAPNPIEAYQINTSTGALTPATGSPFSSDIADLGQFDQSGVYLFAQDLTTLTAYKVASNGVLTGMGNTVQGFGTLIAVTDVP